MEQQSPPKSKRKSAPGAAGPRRSEPSLSARALRLLARREHTRLELERKLAPYADEPAALQSLLDDFTGRGWLSEARAVDQLVHARRGRFGASRIRQTLIEKGVSVELIATALETLKASELDAARAVWSKKFKAPADTPAARARQVRFLQYRGFSVDIAMRVVRGAASDDGES